ncbi:hypothetical protein CEQ90_06950 [Lewinellaceae bacterium SD302]|nr:hypothetical protein CEQ90_06950 [Lewinellaceae bacterium SD302]
MNTKSAILWSVIAAAFVGPGTVATAAFAGSEGGITYLIPLLIALLAGYLLMEMAARITLITGQPLGVSVRSAIGNWVAYPLFGGIFLGCAAYEAGNLMGGLAGLRLFGEIPRYWVLPISLVAAAILLAGSTKRIGRILALVVVFMGAMFLFAGLGVVSSGTEVAGDSVYGLRTSTILSLFGTTIVPYNFMLAAGLGPGQSLSAMRNGLGISFLVGGLITLGILLTGTAIENFSDFASLATALETRLGSFGKIMLGLGLFTAGFSSAITAPLAAAIAGQTLFTTGEENKSKWTVNSLNFRLVWGTILGLGTLVALLELKIIPVILATQLVNALLLPFLVVLVLYLGNQSKLLATHTNRIWQNLGGLLIFFYLTYKSTQVILSFLGVTDGFWIGELMIAAALTAFVGREVFGDN